MRWRWRKREAEPSSDEGTGQASLDLARTSHEEALTRLEESFDARTKVAEQREKGLSIAETLARIRAENPFQELWNEGLRG